MKTYGYHGPYAVSLEAVDSVIEASLFGNTSTPDYTGCEQADPNSLDGDRMALAIFGDPDEWADRVTTAVLEALKEGDTE